MQYFVADAAVFLNKPLWAVRNGHCCKFYNNILLTKTEGNSEYCVENSKNKDTYYSMGFTGQGGEGGTYNNY